MSVIVEDKNTKKIRKNIVNLAWPAILRLFLQSVVGIVDIIMVGQLGARAIAAVDISNKVVFITIGSLMALAVGSTTLVAHHVGAKETKKASKILEQSLICAFLMALFLTFISFVFSRDILNLMIVMMENKDPFILDAGSQYLKIVFASMIFGLPMIINNAVLQGVGDMKTPLYIMIVTNLVNIVFNYLFIFGIGVFPAMGVTGAALGTGLSRVVGALIGFFILSKGRSGLKLNVNSLTSKLDLEVIKNIFNIGIPAAIEHLIRQSGHLIYTALVAGLGTLNIAANAIAMNVLILSFMPSFGFGMAATTLVGQSLGAGKKELAEEYGKQTTYMGVGLIVIVSSIMFLFTGKLVNLYTENAQVINLAIKAIKIILLVQPFLAITMVLSGALRGAGDTKWVMYITAIGHWGVRLVLTLVLVFYLDYGLMGFWIAAALDVVVRTGLIIKRYVSNKWKDLEIRSRSQRCNKCQPEANNT